MFLEPRRETIVSSAAVSFHFISFHFILFYFEFTRYSRNKLRIGVHAAVNNRFGHVALDGEIWYLS